MDSLYAKYLKEKTEDRIIEFPEGFITYRYLPNQQTVYIIDLYVLPEFRKTNVASTKADIVVEEARKRGCNKLLGSVVPSNKSSTTSMKVLMAYGMTLESATNDFVVFKKDI